MASLPIALWLLCHLWLICRNPVDSQAFAGDGDALSSQVSVSDTREKWTDEQKQRIVRVKRSWYEGQNIFEKSGSVANDNQWLPREADTRKVMSARHKREAPEEAGALYSKNMTATYRGTGMRNGKENNESTVSEPIVSTETNPFYRMPDLHSYRSGGRPGKLVRKEVRQLTSAQWKDFTDALNEMKKTDSVEPSYDTFMRIHCYQMAPGSHHGAGFLPWHREFLWR